MKGVPKRNSTSRISSRAWSTRCPVAEALSCAGVRRSFVELDRRANQLAHGLRELGVRRDEHVGIFAYNSVEFVETMLACYKIRAVPLNINFRYIGAELEYLLVNGDVTTLVFDSSLGPRRYPHFPHRRRSCGHAW